MGRLYRSLPIVKHRAGELRKKCTPAESLLWAHLRGDRTGYTFRRQHAIGIYVATLCAYIKS
jgi:very-short-patch-repair endonuclease